MSVLRNLETKLADLVEGTFGRVFRSEVRPVELARKLAREMDEHKTVSVSRTYVPNEYAIWLSPEDRQRYEGVEQEVIDELSAYLLEHARRERLALVQAEGRRLVIAPGGAVVGRSRECDVVLGDSNVSRRHAEIRPGAGGQWTVSDLGSTNGVQVNGRRITGATPLKAGDRLVFGT